ncbi:MAG: thioredoxin family protein [Chloroflexi bacterium]|nr:MAG: thioredoxin family protein [Chloroflexota bacterium]
MAPVPLNVTLLTLHGCHLCDHARDVLSRLGRERPLVVEEASWDSDEGQRLVQRDGIPFAPAVYIDGSFAAYGRISEGALRRRLGDCKPSRWPPWRRLP